MHRFTTAIGGMLTPAAHAAATFAAGRCAAMLPVCLDAIFTHLTPAQRRELATTIVTELAAVPRRHPPTLDPPVTKEGDLS